MIDIYSLFIRISAVAIFAAPVAGRATTPTNAALTNPGLESPFFAVWKQRQISGDTANGWSENSAWSNSTVQLKIGRRTDLRLCAVIEAAPGEAQKPISLEVSVDAATLSLHYSPVV
jgi:hypothetical protein